MFWADRSPSIGLIEGNLATMIAFAHVNVRSLFATDKRRNNCLPKLTDGLS
jgi:hypothetical protein